MEVRTWSFHHINDGGNYCEESSLREVLECVSNCSLKGVLTEALSFTGIFRRTSMSNESLGGYSKLVS